MTQDQFRAKLRTLAKLWEDATKYQNGSDGTKRVSMGDKFHCEALTLENELVELYSQSQDEIARMVRREETSHCIRCGSTMFLCEGEFASPAFINGEVG